MLRYFLKRCLASIPTLLGISILCFLLVQLMPGGPVEQTLAEWRNSGVGGETGGGRLQNITEEQRQALVAYYGFDKPLPQRYVAWCLAMLRLDFGESYHYGEPVIDLLRRALPVSLSLGGFAFLLTYLICLPLGIMKAVRDGSRFDVLSSGLLFLLYSIPSFALGIVLLVLFGGGSYWNLFPMQGLVSENYSELGFFAKITDYLHHLCLPLVCYTIGSFAATTMLMKNSLLEQLRADYMTAARARGLTSRSAILRHALRNALLPIAHGLGQWLTVFFTGSLLIETIFGLQGIGRLSFEAIVRRDYPIVLANIVILSVLHIAGNLLSDLLYVAIDPRIDYA